MKKAFLCVICFAAMFGIAVPAQAFELGVRGYYWLPGLTGDLKVDAAGVTGTTIDMVSGLGMEDESYPVIEAFIGVGGHHLSLSRYRAEYSGTKKLTEEIKFMGETYNVAETISSSLEYDVSDIMYRYDLLDLENVLAGFSLGVVGRVKTFEGDVTIKSKTASFSTPIPMVGLNLHVGILAGLLEARVLATGIGYSGGSIIDGQADISFTPFPFVDVHGGYRTFTIDADADDVEFNYDTSGPYVAVTIGF
ncbi:MAG: hypothetical protein HWN68_10490 [Desulfobacterales bacterium]|nr:hypothetical protein [Desulfobacterales bacterium]